MNGARRQPFLAWPGVALRETLPWCLAFGALFVLCYAGAAWWTARTGTIPAWKLPFEDGVPFMPGWSVVYLTITPVLLLSPFVLRTRRELAPFALTLCFETLAATCCFLLFPQSTELARPMVEGWSRAPFSIADAINLRFNEFPSLHVAFAISAAWAFARRSSPAGRFAWAVWSVAVALSTWLMREHHLADIVGGIVLATLGMGVIDPWLRRPLVLATIRAELLCLQQCGYFSRRHLRYFVIFLAIYGPSLAHWRRYRALRVGFCSAQWIDDLLDGHRAAAGEPLEIIDDLLAEIETDAFSDRPLSQLTAAFLRELPALTHPGDDPRADFVALIRTMQRDRRRVLNHELWSEEQLRDHHRRTFALSVNLLLLTSGCRARADAAPALIEALGWCSTFRDLEDDTSRGLINVPASVWPRIAAGPLPFMQRLSLDPEARDWVRREWLRGADALEKAATELALLDDPRARSILHIFLRSMRRFEKRLAIELGADSPAATETGAAIAARPR